MVNELVDQLKYFKKKKSLPESDSASLPKIRNFWRDIVNMKNLTKTEKRSVKEGLFCFKMITKMAQMNLKVAHDEASSNRREIAVPVDS